MSKVVLTREQAEALEHLKNFYKLTYENIIKSQVLNTFERENWNGYEKCLNGLSLDTLIKALYIGYEVEQTPEERLLEAYNKIPEPGAVVVLPETIKNVSQAFHFGWKVGVRNALDALGITIPGINGEGDE